MPQQSHPVSAGTGRKPVSMCMYVCVCVCVCICFCVVFCFWCLRDSSAVILMNTNTCFLYHSVVLLGPLRRRVEAKLINWPFSPLRLANWLRTANIGSLTADPHLNHVVNFNQAKLIMAFARARPTSKGRKGRSPKPWFSNSIMAEKIKERAVIFFASKQAIIISLYEDQKTLLWPNQTPPPLAEQDRQLGKKLPIS